jgi:pimeloyl-ACP methyl ester carboxylesterase
MESLEEAARRIQKADMFIADALAVELAQHATKPHPDGGVSWKYDPLHRARSGVPFLLGMAEELWRNITVPVLHIKGEKSAFQLDDFHDRSTNFSDFRELAIKGAGHNIHAHEPHALADAVRPFLNECFK